MLDIFGAVGRVLPGYVQGHRQAVADNWNDLNQYNQVQGGQIQNAFDESMFNPRLSIGYDAAANSRMGVYNNGMNLNLSRAAYPGAMANAQIGSLFQPYLSWATNAGQLAAGMGLVNQGWGNPMMQPGMMGAMPQQPMMPQQQGMPWLSMMPNTGYPNQLAAAMQQGMYGQPQMGAVNLPSIYGG